MEVILKHMSKWSIPILFIYVLIDTNRVPLYIKVAIYSKGAYSDWNFFVEAMIIRMAGFYHARYDKFA